MERVTLKGKTFLVGYHTQEWRPRTLDSAIKCHSFEAWLGIGYYFWTEIEFAHHWGRMFKIEQTGAYDIYRAHLDIDDCINAVFDERGYFFFRKQIEKAIAHLKGQGHYQVTLLQVHRFLADNVWPNTSPPISGVLFDDIPQNPKDKSRVYSEITPLYYKKRIQVVLFNRQNMTNFELLIEDQS